MSRPFNSELSNKSLSPLPNDRYPPTTPPPTGGGGRDTCPSEDESPSPLMPLAPEVYAYGGLTLAEQPTLWLYLPFDVTPEMAIELSIEPSENDSLDSLTRTFTAPDLQQGFVGIPLSSTQFSLPLDESFLWTLRLYCGGIDETDGLDYLFAKAWITRVDETDVYIPIPENAVGEVLSEAYRDNGLWYDALTVLGEPLATGDATTGSSAAWEGLLEDGGFESLTEESPVQFLVLPTE
ncbi:MAG: DUF928 domain-containing protein [Leptolyngbya sp. SIOISBB]|nr:DUF928 domain-containing protein [Leptolyngbya sp. SIOISBB]